MRLSELHTSTKIHKSPLGESVDNAPAFSVEVHQNDDGTFVAALDDYDGAPDAGHNPTGRGKTRQSAIEELRDQVYDTHPHISNEEIDMAFAHAHAQHGVNESLKTVSNMLKTQIFEMESMEGKPRDMPPGLTPEQEEMWPTLHPLMKNKILKAMLLKSARETSAHLRDLAAKPVPGTASYASDLAAQYAKQAAERQASGDRRRS